MALERTARSPSLAAAAQRGRYAYSVRVSDSIQLAGTTVGDSISAWTSAITSILKRNNRTPIDMAWQSRRLKRYFGGPWRIDRDEKDRGLLWVGRRRGGIFA